MGNLCASNEPSFADKLREQLCHIAEEYESLELICGYIGIFELVPSSKGAIQSADSNSLSPVGAHSNSYSYVHGATMSMHHAQTDHDHNNNNNNHSHNPYDYNNLYDTHSDHNETDSTDHRHHHHNSSTRSNLKVKEKKDIELRVDLDYAQFYQWKIEQVYKENPNITDQELSNQYGLSVNASSNNIFASVHLINNPLIDLAKIANINNDNQDDEKERLLKQQQQHQNQQQQQAQQQPQSQKGSPSKTLPSANVQKKGTASALQTASKAAQQQNEQEKRIQDMVSIRETLTKNDIKSSVQSLGDTTNQLCAILDRAKIFHSMRDDLAKKMIHIRGNKQTIFSYYFLLNRYIIISYAQYKSELLEFREWIKIQSKLEKLEVTLKDIEALLNEENKN